MFNKIIEKLKDKKIAILGFGREGKSTYDFISRHLDNQDITILDKNDIDVDCKKVIGDNYLDNLNDYDIIIKSPGISLKDTDINPIKDKITSQLELLLEVNSNNMIGITGTKGKSTTTSLTYEVLKDQLEDVFLLGNIGKPVLDEVEKYTDKTILVIEMSSHQLEFVRRSPHIAAILNLYQDHLDHDGTVEHYHQNKLNIFKYQTDTDYYIYSDDNPDLNKKINDYPYRGIRYTVRFDNENLVGNRTRLLNKDVIINDKIIYHDNNRLLLGDHNLKNIMFVLTIAKIMNLDLERAKKVIDNFKGLKYRMEYIGNANGIDFYNDTIATIPDATINAINSIPNIETLILGGLDRGIDYEPFIKYLKESKLNTIICMPTTGIKIGKALEDTNKKILYANTLEEAYKEAVNNTEIDKACILSPAAASYEFFKNFEEKGKAFEEIVKKDIN